MNILFIADVFDDTLGSAVIVNQNFIQAFKNHSVSLITSEYKTEKFLKDFFVDIIEVKEKYFPGEERVLHGMLGWKAICRKFLGQSPRHIKLKRALKNAIQNLLTKKKFDCIYALGTVMDAPQYFALNEINPNCLWGINVHDPFPVVNYPEPYSYKWDSEQVYQRKQFFDIYNKAKFITYPSLLLKEYMESLYGKPSCESFVIPHLSFLPIATENNKTQKLSFLHSGSINSIRTPQFIIDAFTQIQEENPSLNDQIELVFSGAAYGTQEELSKWAKFNITINNKRITYAESLKEMQTADVLLILEANVEQSPFLPGKAADYVVANKSILVLSNKGSELNRIFYDESVYQSTTQNIQEIIKILTTIIYDYRGNCMRKPSKNIINYFSADTNPGFQQFLNFISNNKN